MTSEKKQIISVTLSPESIRKLDKIVWEKHIRSRSQAIQRMIENEGKEKNGNPVKEKISEAFHAFEQNYKMIFEDYVALIKTNPEKNDQVMKEKFDRMNATSKELLNELKKWENKML